MVPSREFDLLRHHVDERGRKIIFVDNLGKNTVVRKNIILSSELNKNLHTKIYKYHNYIVTFKQTDIISCL